MAKLASIPTMISENLGPSLLKGLGYGAGASLPVLALMSHAKRQTDASVKNLRNQALLSALGIGAAGVGGMALQRKFMPKSVETETTEEGPMGPFHSIKKTKLGYEAGIKAACETFKVANVAGIGSLLGGPIGAALGADPGRRGAAAWAL